MVARITRVVVAAASLGALAVAAHTAVNLRRLPRATSTAPVHEPVSVLIPARDEAADIGDSVRSVLAQVGVCDLELRVLDDGSTDGTADLVDALARTDPRLEVQRSRGEPPDGWLGKPWACSRLADGARGTVLVFVDADVRLAPHAVTAAVGMLRANGLALLAPYPRQHAGSWLERVTQPLVSWAPFALLPLGWQRRSRRPSLSAANGQLLVADAHAYRAIGGHGAVRDRVIDDVSLMASFRRAGYAAWTIDGSELATCRMYRGPRAVRAGYEKSLWAAFGGPVGGLAVCAALLMMFVLPATALVLARDPRTRGWAGAGYAAAVTSRALVARRTGEPVVDAVAHPMSIVALVVLTALSWRGRYRGTLRWKGREVVVR